LSLQRLGPTFFVALLGKRFITGGFFGPLLGSLRFNFVGFGR